MSVLKRVKDVLSRVVERIDPEQYEAKLSERCQTLGGLEIPDATPMEPPIGYNPQPSMMDHIRNLVRAEQFRQEMDRAGNDTFEEADDFDVEDDPEPVSAYNVPDDLDPVSPPTPSSPVPLAQPVADAPAGGLPATPKPGTSAGSPSSAGDRPEAGGSGRVATVHAT